MKSIGTTDWLTKGMSAEQIAEKKAKAIAECNAEIRAEAIKEVYTRLSMNFGTYTDNDSVKLVDLFRLFDQIAKEMGVEL